MYDNIGGKIKGLAKTMFIVEAIGAVITGIVLLATNDDLIFAGLLTLFCGPIIAWISSWVLYAFGELVEDIHAMRNKYYPIAEEQANLETEEKAECKTDEKENTTKEQEDYYILNGETKSGPYDIKELSEKVAQGILKPYTYVWKKGMPKWVSAKDVDGLSDLFTSPSSSNE